MRIIRFTSAVSCGILRPSQRAFGTYLCVYRKEDDHTTPDRKSSGWMILSAMWLRRTMFPLSGSRTADSFFSFFMPSGSKSASLRMVTQRRTFCMHSFVYSPVYLPVIYIFTAYHPLIFTLCLYTAPSPHPVIFSTYFLPQHRCFHRFFLRRSADPPGSPPSILPTAPLFFRQLCSVPRPAILTVALVPLYLQLPSSRYTCSCPRPAILAVAPSPSPLR